MKIPKYDKAKLRKYLSYFFPILRLNLYCFWSHKSMSVINKLFLIMPWFKNRYEIINKVLKSATNHYVDVYRYYMTLYPYRYLCPRQYHCILLIRVRVSCFFCSWIIVRAFRQYNFSGFCKNGRILWYHGRWTDGRRDKKVSNGDRGSSEAYDVWQNDGRTTWLRSRVHDKWKTLPT